MRKTVFFILATLLIYNISSAERLMTKSEYFRKTISMPHMVFYAAENICESGFIFTYFKDGTITMGRPGFVLFKKPDGEYELVEGKHYEITQDINKLRDDIYKFKELYRKRMLFKNFYSRELLAEYSNFTLNYAANPVSDKLLKHLLVFKFKDFTVCLPSSTMLDSHLSEGHLKRIKEYIDIN